MTTQATASKRQVPGNKVGAAAIWTVGAVMTYAALDQISDFTPGALFVTAIIIQFVLTQGQSPVWTGRGNMLSYACLLVDATFNFGGCMAFMAHVDQMGSVQAMGMAFFSWAGELPMPLKGILALMAAAIIAGLPEYLWRLD